MTKKTTYLAAALMLLCLGQACDQTEPGEGVPAYVYVSEIQFQAGQDQGSSSSNITEVWVTAGNQALGAYRIPARIPILASGETEVRFEGGIRENGIAQAALPWVFFADDIRTLDLVPTKTDTVSVQLSYSPGTQFAFIDDFETPGISFNTLLIGQERNKMQRTQDDAFEGNYSGLIELDTAQTVVSLLTTTPFSGLNAINPRVYLEVNYRSDVPVIFGVGVPSNIAGETETFFEAGFNRSSTWKKIYLSLGEAILNSQANTYQIVLQAFATEQDDFGDDGKARVYLDNIKLVHF